MAAFAAGLASGADGLELDVRLSRDGVVVVHHDRTLDRTTSAAGEVGHLTADELARVDAGCRFERDGGRPFANRGIGVPTLDDVLARHPSTRIIVELKVNTAELARAVVGLIRRRDAVERVCLAAFGLRVLRAARALEPAIATSAAREEVRWALYRSWCRWPVSRAPYAGYQVPERAGSTRIVSPRFVEYARRAGLAVQVWTVDSDADARRLLDWGVNALITDRPDIVAPISRSHALLRCRS
jgi:glycerophosphoryl diester phosphodiesterase